MQYVTFSFTTTDEEGNSSEMTDEEKAELKTQAEEFAAGAAGASDFSAYASQQGYEAVEGTFDSESTDIRKSWWLKWISWRKAVLQE